MSACARRPLRAVVVGTGNVGVDLLAKLRRSPCVEVVGVAGIDRESPGLARAAADGIATTHRGLADLLERVPDVDVAFDASSAQAHGIHARLLAERGIRSIDLTPSWLGEAVVPSLNLDAHAGAPEVSLVTCSAQATVPIVAALARVGIVQYAEVTSTLSAASAGPALRQSIDECTAATARALERVGGAGCSKAVVQLDPADPPAPMRNHIYVDMPEADAGAVTSAVEETAARVARHLPGYRLTAPPQVDGNAIVIRLEVEGRGPDLPRHAGSVDVVTAAAVRVAEAQHDHSD
jgi:acetaldehyde dehydrogenase